MTAAQRVRIQVLPHGLDLPPPTRASSGAAGYDLRAAVEVPITLASMERACVPCGFCMSIPMGWEAQLRPRSGLAARHGVTLLNSPGTIDADYRGEVQVVLMNFGATAFTVCRGDRIAQMVFSRFEAPDIITVDALDATNRGSGGFGSTG